MGSKMWDGVRLQRLRKEKKSVRLLAEKYAFRLPIAREQVVVVGDEGPSTRLRPFTRTFDAVDNRNRNLSAKTKKKGT